MKSPIWVGARRLEELIRSSTHHGQEVFVLSTQESAALSVTLYVTAQVVVRFADGADEIRYWRMQVGRFGRRAGAGSGEPSAEATAALGKMESAEGAVREYILAFAEPEPPHLGRQLKVVEAGVVPPKDMLLFAGTAECLEYVEAEGVYRLRAA